MDSLFDYFQLLYVLFYGVLFEELRATRLSLLSFDSVPNLYCIGITIITDGNISSIYFYFDFLICNIGTNDNV